MDHEVQVSSVKPAPGVVQWQAVCLTENAAVGDPQDDHAAAYRLKEEHEAAWSTGERDAPADS